VVLHSRWRPSRIVSWSTSAVFARPRLHGLYKIRDYNYEIRFAISRREENAEKGKAKDSTKASVFLRIYKCTCDLALSGTDKRSFSLSFSLSLSLSLSLLFPFSLQRMTSAFSFGTIKVSDVPRVSGRRAEGTTTSGRLLEKGDENRRNPTPRQRGATKEEKPRAARLATADRPCGR